MHAVIGFGAVLVIALAFASPSDGITFLDVLNDWEILGHAVLADKVVRLTPDAQSKVGIATSREPLHLGDTWQATAGFRIHGAGLTLVGDGVALWYTRDKLYVHPSGLFGANPRYAGLGVFLATYVGESRLPHISLVVNDGTELATSRASGQYQSSLHPAAGCDLDRHLSGDAFISLRVRVSDGGHRIDVHYNVGSAGLDEKSRTWTTCTSISDSGIHIESGFLFGTSATTGDLTDTHDLVEFSVVSKANAQSEVKHSGSNVVPMEVAQQTTPQASALLPQVG